MVRKSEDAQRVWHIDYRLTGTITVKAASKDLAQEWFDKQLANGTPSWFDANGEVSNDPPYESGEQP